MFSMSLCSRADFDSDMVFDVISEFALVSDFVLVRSPLPLSCVNRCVLCQSCVQSPLPLSMLIPFGLRVMLVGLFGFQGMFHFLISSIIVVSAFVFDLFPSILRYGRLSCSSSSSHPNLFFFILSRLLKPCRLRLRV